MVTVNTLEGRKNRSLGKIPGKVRRNIVSGVKILREIKSTEEKNKLINIRGKFYAEKGIAEPCEGEDPFDKDARFFVLEGYRDNVKYSKVCRLVNRNSLGILPSELNLKNKGELCDFFSRNGCNVNYDVLEKST